jgi:hypothetical protein
MKPLLLTLTMLLTRALCAAQIIAEGYVTDFKTKHPIQYVSIGIAGTEVGTISNADGSFSLPLPLNYSNDSITFSAIGYHRLTLHASEFLNTPHRTVVLVEKVTVLKDVVVVDRREKTKAFELGNTHFNSGEMEPDTTYSGRSVALLIDTISKEGNCFPLSVEKVNLRIYRNNLPLTKFRLRINEVSSVNGEPGADILDKNVVVESAMKNGWLEFDLTPHSIVVSNPFYITFEQILDSKDRTMIADGFREFMRRYPERLHVDTVFFDGKKEVRKTISRGGIDLPGTYIGISRRANHYTCYVRESSLSPWEKTSATLSAYVTVKRMSR